MIDIDRERARYAFNAIQHLKSLVENENENNPDEAAKRHYGNYVSFSKSLPAAILQLGLGQALASELAASNINGNATEKGHYWICKHLCEWLGRESPLAPYPDKYDDENLSSVLAALVSEEQSKYILAQHEAIAYVAWIKKFAVALLIQPEGET